MKSIHIADPQGRQQVYEPEAALRLWTEGAIPRDSLYWCDGMTEWRPAVEYFASSPGPTAPGTLPPPIPASVPRGFAKDPGRLTRCLIVMLWAYLAACGLAVVLTAISLVTGQAGQPETDELSLHNMVGLPQMFVVLVTDIIFLMWIHRANRNARGLGAQGMTFTPGWSVGWYFVPFANLWKPYQAMKEIWKASANPASWPSEKPPPLLATWWTLWIVSNVLSNMSFRMSMRADTGPELLASEIVTLISDLLDIPLCLVALRLVRGIIRLQTHWAAQGTQAIQTHCEICRQPRPTSDMILLNQTWVCAQCKPILLQQIREGGLGQ
jgi:hypothetical protein